MSHFFCSKDCPDLCGMEMATDAALFKVAAGQPQDWCAPGFVCGKFNTFIRREIDNGLLSWQRTPGGRVDYADAPAALDALASWLAPLRDKKILYLRGSGSLGYNMGYWDQLFSQFPGAVSISGDPCDATGSAAHYEDFRSVSNPPVTALAQAQTIILYGKNAAVTSPHLAVYLQQLRRNGTEIILIDPVRTATARLADHYIQIQPASDGLVACALLTRLGYEKDHSVSSLLTAAGISDADFALLLDRIARRKVAHIQGLGMQRHENGMNAIRWINRLAVRTGAQDLLYYGHGSKRFWYGHPAWFDQQLPIDEVPQRLAQGEFDLFVNIAANPAVTYPDSNRWARGLAKTTTLVVDTNDSATTGYADFFLKVGGMFAQTDFMGSYFFPHRQRRQALTRELSDMAAAQGIAERLGISLQIRDEAELSAPLQSPRRYQTEHLELMMPTAARPFRLLTASHPAYLNSQTLPGQETGRQVVLIHPDDAEKRQIGAGDRVRIVGDCGHFTALAQVTDRVGAGVLMCWKNLPMPEGLCNSAISSRLTDSRQGLAYYAAPVDIVKSDGHHHAHLG